MVTILNKYIAKIDDFIKEEAEIYKVFSEFYKYGIFGESEISKMENLQISDKPRLEVRK